VSKQTASEEIETVGGFKESKAKKTPLQTALATYLETKTLAETPVTGDPRTAPGREGQRRQAEGRLDQLLAGLREELKKAASCVFLSGPGQQQFVDQAAKLGPVVVVKGDGVARELANQVLPSIGSSQTFGLHQHTIMVQGLRQIGVGLSVGSLPTPEYRDSEVVPDFESLVDVVEKYLTQSSGNTFKKLAIEHEALQSVIANGVVTKIVPVFILGSSKEEAASIGPGLFAGNFVVVDTKEEVTEDDVKTALQPFKKNKGN